MSRFATDLLRVLAACYIVFNHVSWPVFQAIGTPHEYWLSWATALGNQFGKPSVLFFIFLSGFAFSGLAGDRQLSTGRFYLNRVARILPPFVVVTIIAFACPFSSCMTWRRKCSTMISTFCPIAVGCRLA